MNNGICQSTSTVVTEQNTDLEGLLHFSLDYFFQDLLEIMISLSDFLEVR